MTAFKETELIKNETTLFLFQEEERLNKISIESRLREDRESKFPSDFLFVWFFYFLIFAKL